MKKLKLKREELSDNIGTEYTKLVNSHGSVEKNLDFNAAKWGAEKGFDAASAEWQKIVEPLVEALRELSKTGPFEQWPQIIAMDAIADYKKEIE